MMKLRTKLDAEGTIKISHAWEILSIGSCFTENVGQKIQEHAIACNINPFGILYNPMSIAQNLDRLIQGNPYQEDELTICEDRWVSFDHHGSFSSTHPKETLNHINTVFNEAHEQLKKAHVLIITFGTSFVYRKKSNAQIIANCHKFPKKDFERIFIPKEEITNSYQRLIAKLRTFNPKLDIIFTVSPVRHLRDSFIENTKSKSNLILTVHDILENTKNTEYFPAYEIMMDDLRDYRFYNEDMVHPSDIAIQYIWDKFKTAHISSTSWEIIDEAHKLFLASMHKPLHPDSASHKKFLKTHLEKTTALQSKYPSLQLEDVRKAFEAKH